MNGAILQLWHKLKRYPQDSLLLFASGVVLLVAAAFAIGLISASQMIRGGSALTTDQAGPWRHWRMAGAVGADPYTRARVAMIGRLPITSSNSLYYMAKTDSSGVGLRAGCAYVLSGNPINAEWWSLAAYRPDGTLPNAPLEHLSVSSSNLVRDANGDYRIILSSQARAGNWIKLAGTEKFVLFLRVYGSRLTQTVNKSDRLAGALPKIRRLNCP